MNNCARSTLLFILCGSVLLLAACGGEAPDQSNTPATPVPADRQAETTVAAAPERLDICHLLTPEQVASVLPDHDGGSVTQAGSSLLAGIDTWQCSYTAQHDEDVDLLTGIVTVAPNDELFKQIEPTGFAYDEDQQVSVGDRGWIDDGEEDDLHVQAVKGRAVIDLELLATGAQTRRDALLQLAREIASQL
ncbi:MAG: hypothetical protein IT494_08725 [Gammaproteobacteria bacterium]|nr:hypothetical protein [Gammaproteobacteria bacterium]